MQLVLFRHGDALPLGERGTTSDEDRPLSAKGKRQVRLSTEGLIALRLIPEVILTSPLLRARQTTDIIVRNTDEPIQVEESVALSSGDGIKRLMQEISRRMDCPCLMMVGHQPLLGRLASRLQLGTDKYEFPLKKAGIIHFELEGVPPEATLINLLSPQVLAKIADLD